MTINYNHVTRKCCDHSGQSAGLTGLCVTANCVVTNLRIGPGSSVGIATAYGLDGPGIESRCGQDFPHLSRPALRPTQHPVKWVPGLSGGASCGRGVTLTLHPDLTPRSKIE